MGSITKRRMILIGAVAAIWISAVAVHQLIYPEPKISKDVEAAPPAPPVKVNARTAAGEIEKTPIGAKTVARLTASEEALPVEITVGTMAAPGAIVCPNLDTVRLMHDQFVQHIRDNILRAQSPATQRQQALLHGDTVVSSPDPAAFGCVLLPSGTPVHVDRSAVVPLIVTIFEGIIVRGVTLPAMLEPAPQQASGEGSAQPNPLEDTQPQEGR